MGPQGPRPGPDALRGQADALGKLLSARASATSGLPPLSRPFAGVTGTRTSAAKPKLPDLSARVALAKAERQRLTHGGLAAPGDQHERKATDVIVRDAPPLAPPPKPPAAPAHQPVYTPPEPTVSRGTRPAFGARGGVPDNPQLPPPISGLHVSDILAGALAHGVHIAARNSVIAPLAELLAHAPTRSAVGTVASRPLNSVIAPAVSAADKGAGTAIAAAASLPGTLTTPLHPTYSGGALGTRTMLTPAERVTPQSAAEAAAGIGEMGLHRPAFIPKGDITTAGAATFRQYTPEQFVAAGLDSPAQTEAFRQMALKRGWFRGEIENLNGLDLIDHAYSNPPNIFLRIAQNAATGAAQTAALPNFVTGVAQSVASGHGLAPVTQIGNNLSQQAGELLKNPWEAFVSQPYTVVPEVGGALKIAGTAGLLRSAEGMAARDVALHGSENWADTGGKPVSIQRGRYSRNLYTETGERLHDWWTSHTDLGARAAWRQFVDRAQQHAANAESPAIAHQLRREEALARTGNILGRGGIGNARARIIQIAQRFGGVHSDGTVDLVALHNALKGREAAALRDGLHSMAAEQARVLREEVTPGLVDEHAIPQTPAAPSEPHPSGIEPRGLRPGEGSRMTPEDIRYAQAHEDLAAHTTQVLQGLGAGFDQTAAMFRRYEQMLVHDAPLEALHGEGSQTRTGDALAIRVFKTRAAYFKAAKAHHVTPGVPLPPEVEAAKQAYDHAMSSYAARHIDAGGARPVRSEYYQPPTGRERMASKFGFSDNPPPVHPSTSQAAETGNFLHDVTSAQHESMAAQRVATKVEAFHNVLQQVGHLVPERTKVPDGYVFVSEKNATTLGKVMHDLHPGTVGDEHGLVTNAEGRLTDSHEADSGMMKRLDEMLGKAKRSKGDGGMVTQEQGWLVPHAAFERMKEYTQPLERNIYLKALGQYQKLLIGTGPGTLLGNTLGTVPLGMLGGAGLSDYRAVLRHTIDDPSLVPMLAHGRGVSGALTPEETSAIGRYNPNRYVNTMLRLSRTGEDVTREALYLSKMGGWKGMTERAAGHGYVNAEGKTTIEEVKAYARDVAVGKIDTELRDAAVAHTIKFVGDNLAPVGKLGYAVSHVVMFHKWVGHVATLMLKTLPIEHPLRLELINVLSQYGDQYRKDHGVYPSWMMAFAPIFKTTIAGQAFTGASNLGWLSPQSVAGGTLENLTANQSWLSNLASIANPAVGGAINVGLDQKAASPGKPAPSIPWEIAAYALRAIPHATNLVPYTQRPPDYFPYLHSNVGVHGFRVHPSGARDPNTGKSLPLQPQFRPGARALGQDVSPTTLAFWEGAASRFMANNIYEVPNTGIAVHNELGTAQKRGMIANHQSTAGLGLP